MTLPAFLPAQDRITTEEYIDTYKEVAIRKMKEYGIPASITLAQGILESGSGNSKLAEQANNHFGIKCHKDWTGKTFTMDDDEKNECFRKYKNAEDSYRDHSLFLTQRDRYAFLFDYDITDYESWAYGLKKAGYATNPKYPQLLINLIERYELYRFDGGTDGKKKEKVAERSTVEKEVPANKLTFASLLAASQPVYESIEGRKVYENNGIPFIVVEQGDSFNRIAQEFDIYSWQLYKYNDLDRRYVLKAGEILYLEKKKRKAGKAYDVHYIEQGQNIRYVSQLYGVRISRLAKMNGLEEKQNLRVGTKIRLR